MASSSPSHIVQESKLRERREEARLQHIEDALSKSQRLTDSMGRILSEFESRFEKLEQVLEPMSRRMEDLQLAHNNIDATLGSMDRVLAKFNVAAEYEARILEGINGNLESFLFAFDKVNEASTYLQNNRNFKSAEKTIATLKSLLGKALSTLEHEFYSYLDKCSNPLDPNKFADGLPESLEIMAHKSVADLFKIIQRLHNLGYTSYLKTYKELRSKALQQSLQRCLNERTRDKNSAPLPTPSSAPKPDLSSKAGKLVSSSSQARDDSASKDDDSKALRYEKGSHRFIFSMQYFVKLLRSEKKIASQLILSAGIESVFGEVVSPAMELFTETATSLVRKKRTNDRAFVLLDLLANLTALRPEFEQIFSKVDSGKLNSEITSFNDTLKASACKLMSEFFSLTLNDPVKLSNDGIVHEHTSNTCTFLKRFFEYRDVADSLLPTVISEIESGANSSSSSLPQTRRGQKPLARYLVLCLHALESNLEVKAKGYKSVSLTGIFLLNNHHYVNRQLQAEEFKSSLDADYISLYGRKIDKDRESYIQSCWQKALSLLDTKTLAAVPPKGVEVSSSLKKEIKNRLSGFNSLFEEMYLTQREYSIPDVELREQVRAQTADTILTPYREFIDRYGGVEFAKNPQEFIKFDFKTLEEMIQHFFEGVKNS